MKTFLKGLVDMHIHGTPSAAPRIETWDYLMEMEQAGYRAIGLKEHFTPTAGPAYMINHCPDRLHIEVTGSLVLNNACGGFSLAAVDAACILDARMIIMPTVSAANHIAYLKTVSGFGGGSLSVPETPLTILDKSGSLKPEVTNILDYLKDRPAVALSTGHLSPAEIDALLPAALSAGIEKVVIEHPYFIIGATTGQVERWASLGAYINFTCSSLEGLGKNGRVPRQILEQTLKIVPEDHLVISTDFGQPYNGSPVEGMTRMLEILLQELHVPEKQVMQMTHEIPAYLLGL